MHGRSREPTVQDEQSPGNVATIFSSSFRDAVDKSVPTKTIWIRRSTQPVWFNRNAEKRVTKQRKTYNKYKRSANPFLLSKYKHERRKNKKAFRQIKRKYVIDKVCKPLEEGNSKPFYKHLRQSRNESHPLMSLKLPDGTVTDNNLKCAETLNSYFKDQFCKEESISDLSQPTLPL